MVITSTRAQQGDHNARHDPLSTTIRQRTGKNTEKAPQREATMHKENIPVSILYKSIADRYRPVSYQ